ncbi:NAD-dependent histone deacetylase sir2 [Orbilia oligospora]|uniref:Deacetylase sirtuin-type domain-containing protein n=2 Tax=Orbilia oligospora TaxID=2813651 RepID=G1WZV4_ARTOA|nr:hypothetical protein AOL_s00006g155 [Orbilia oligospora ATCC 24927]KAF3081658.1 NAD-dependent histone deacetylase sir2 [Orbilia oligospora]EGX53289.1 hypothetical protein AOL_s00006g155 [Orbilia oligospora ATCC 24927]KAF3112386.1 NAD-dependent histone deacetylase sir2 [Orbilia oligospora]KAF3119935.1 NAD-dependent histone deacetylase sir2 [Orbilia oligospora]KAF3123101.1 NAD-dependent histone deacetylase sir2 [Orbilia oligospora]
MESTALTPKSTLRQSPAKPTPSALDLVAMSHAQFADDDFLPPELRGLSSALSDEDDGSSTDEDEPEVVPDVEGSEAESSDWEDQSLYEDMIGAEMKDGSDDGSGAEFCTPEECQYYKDLLRRVGSRAFVDQTVSNGSITAKKLLTAFGLRPPAFLEGSLDSAYFTLLGLMMQREMAKRLKLSHVNSVDDVVELIQSSSNIMVLTGAGISTSLGIPDFRSKGSGLYSRLEGLGLSDPQEVFDIQIFKEDPSIFYSIAKDILPTTSKFSPTHAFIELLQRKGKLLRNYTQNIDNIEQLAGVSPDKLVQCHGSFATASCVKCKFQVSGEEIYDDLRAGKIAKCPKCVEAEVAKQQVGKKRKRGTAAPKSRKNKYNDDSSDEEDWALEADIGVMKPDIIFFGEQLPDRFHRIVDHDRAKVDLLICIGTSLKVAPVSEVPAFLPANVPQIYISREPVHHIEFDVELIGDQCDDIVTELAHRVGWGDEFKHEMIPSNFEVEHSPNPEKTSQHHFSKVTKPLAPALPSSSTFSFTMAM